MNQMMAGMDSSQGQHLLQQQHPMDMGGGSMGMMNGMQGNVGPSMMQQQQMGVDMPGGGFGPMSGGMGMMGGAFNPGLHNARSTRCRLAMYFNGR